MWASLIAAGAPTIAAFAAWRRPKGAARLERIEQMIEDMMQWQIRHQRKHGEEAA